MRHKIGDMHIAIAGNIGAGKTTLTELLAKHYKCEALTITGRFGWKKPLKAHGWKPLHASFQKEI